MLCRVPFTFNATVTAIGQPYRSSGTPAKRPDIFVAFYVRTIRQSPDLFQTGFPAENKAVSQTRAQKEPSSKKCPAMQTALRGEDLSNPNDETGAKTVSDFRSG
jgi:hypothetical protein